MTPEEALKVRTTVENSQIIKKNTSGRKDEGEGQTQLCLWNHPGNDVLGMLVRMKKVAETMEQVIFNFLFKDLRA